MENSMEAPQKTKNKSAIWSSNITLKNILKECKSGYNKGTCTPKFIAALFTVAKLRKQLRWPTNNDWVKKMWYLQTMLSYSATKKNEILSFAGKWMQLENILSEVNQVQKPKCHIVSLMCGNIDLIQIQVIWKTGHIKGRSHTREGG
jgi:hypothetical protein